MTYTKSLTQMTVPQLKRVAKAHGIDGYTQMRKYDLVEAIDQIRYAEGDTVANASGRIGTVIEVVEHNNFPKPVATRYIRVRFEDGTEDQAGHFCFYPAEAEQEIEAEAEAVAASLSPAMVEGLTHFGRTGEWGNTRIGTQVALLDRGLVGHSRQGVEPDQLTELGDAVLAVFTASVDETTATVCQQKARETKMPHYVENTESGEIFTFEGTGWAGGLPLMHVFRENGEHVRVDAAYFVKAFRALGPDRKPQPSGLENPNLRQAFIRAGKSEAERLREERDAFKTKLMETFVHMTLLADKLETTSVSRTDLADEIRKFVRDGHKL